MADVFISYARSAASQAQAVAEGLRALGHSVWRDDDLPAHKGYSEVIQERLAAAKAVVVIWSRDAVKSQWVFSEANRAREDGKLVQLSLDTARLPMPFDSIHCANLAGWSGDLGAHGWKKVVASVAELIGGASVPTLATAVPTVRRHCICVLPFANMSEDPQQEYFSDGISEDIITDLSKVSALDVTARSTSFGFKGRSPNIKEIAGQLGVSHVLEGSVRKAGTRVRISAQLIEGASGNHLWAERYDRELDDIFALQDEISGAIVNVLKLKLLPQEKRAIERRGTHCGAAYDLYLLARSYWPTRGVDPRPNEIIVQLCGNAVEKDPGYAQAWALMASGQEGLHRNFGRANDAGQAALDRALAIDPEQPEARSLRAMLLSNAGRHEEAAAEIAVAVRLGPESYEVQFRAGWLAYGQRLLATAARHYEKATELAETDYTSPSYLISCYAALGDMENMQRAARFSLERAEKVLAHDGTDTTAIETGVSALVALGEAERAKDWMERGLLVDPGNALLHYNFACALALADPEAALAMLAPALELDDGSLLRLAPTDPDFAGMRDDPRFQSMVTAAEARLAAARPADAKRRTKPPKRPKSGR